MIISTGWGFVMILIGAACYGATDVVVNSVMQEHRYFQIHGWTKLLAFWFAAALSWPIGRLMNQSKERRVFDPQTGESFIIRTGGGHSLFFIPVQYWWLIFAFFGVIFALDSLDN